MIVRRIVVLMFAVAMAGGAAVFAGVPRGTFSIVAYDPQTRELGVAVQSRAFSVGAGVPWAEAGVGAIATQASTNESFGPRGLAMLRAGYSAQEVLDLLLASDPGRENRQVGIVDAHGRSASFTGSKCLTWAGDTTGTGFSVQGNILAGPEVVSEMVRAFSETGGELAERLIAALHAAQGAGGDRRGQQSAALLVVRPSQRYPEYRTRYIELRVEDHSDPINELERVFRLHQASDLLRAHLRYAEHFDTTGNTEAVEREREQIGETLVRTLAREDADAGSLNALAWYCATSDMYLEESLDAARRAAEMEPENTAILDTLAEVLFRLGRAKEAIEVIDRAIAIDPDDDYLQGQRKRFKGD
ncbi:MAG: DUF1028 domain-containing protein [Candidatus Latescibacteria bacterium]|nr:DUF1028 domain-containing protein [Candidatus Latescibacterota bacterium]NIO57442.1 DUF1028 domain-containing protein [Candidatus Latescibacterota bacterium]